MFLVVCTAYYIVPFEKRTTFLPIQQNLKSPFLEYLGNSWGMHNLGPMALILASSSSLIPMAAARKAVKIWAAWRQFEGVANSQSLCWWTPLGAVAEFGMPCLPSSFAMSTFLHPWCICSTQEYDQEYLVPWLYPHTWFLFFGSFAAASWKFPSSLAHLLDSNTTKNTLWLGCIHALHSSFFSSFAAASCRLPSPLGACVFLANLVSFSLFPFLSQSKLVGRSSSLQVNHIHTISAHRMNVKVFSNAVELQVWLFSILNFVHLNKSLVIQILGVTSKFELVFAQGEEFVRATFEVSMKTARWWWQQWRESTPRRCDK